MAGNNDRINFHVALYQPEIPQNTGNIGRLCVGSDSTLNLIKPMRFILSDKQLKRAGLDYWHKLTLKTFDSYKDFLSFYSTHRIFFCTTKTSNLYTDFHYRKDDVFLFGPETNGIPENILSENYKNTIRIPMSGKIRSINLANSVSIILYEALRQLNYNPKEE